MFQLRLIRCTFFSLAEQGGRGSAHGHRTGWRRLPRPPRRTWTSKCPWQYPCHARRPRIPGPGRAAPTEQLTAAPPIPCPPGKLGEENTGNAPPPPPGSRTGQPAAPRGRKPGRPGRSGSAGGESRALTEGHTLAGPTMAPQGLRAGPRDGPRRFLSGAEGACYVTG